MKEHILKIWDVYWDAVNSGDKNFEVRRDDRGFQKGDIIILIRLVQSPPSALWTEERTGDNQPRYLRRKIAYILTGGQLGIEPGYVVMGLKK